MKIIGTLMLIMVLIFSLASFVRAEDEEPPSIIPITSASTTILFKEFIQHFQLNILKWWKEVGAARKVIGKWGIFISEEFSEGKPIGIPDIVVRVVKEEKEENPPILVARLSPAKQFNPLQAASTAVNDTILLLAEQSANLKERK